MRTIAQIIDENKNKVNEDNMDAALKKQIADLKKDIDNIVKSMDIGDFTYKGCDASNCYFRIGSSRWYEWHFCYDYDFAAKSHHITFYPIASYGSFDFGDDTYKFYKSVGILLSQEDALHKIEEKFGELYETIKRAQEE